MHSCAREYERERETEAPFLRNKLHICCRSHIFIQSLPVASNRDCNLTAPSRSKDMAGTRSASILSEEISFICKVCKCFKGIGIMPALNSACKSATFTNVNY